MNRMSNGDETTVRADDNAAVYPPPVYRIGLALPPMTRRTFLRTAGLLAIVLTAGGYAVYVFLPIAGAAIAVTAAAAWLVWRYVRRRLARHDGARRPPRRV